MQRKKVRRRAYGHEAAQTVEHFIVVKVIKEDLDLGDRAGLLPERGTGRGHLLSDALRLRLDLRQQLHHARPRAKATEYYVHHEEGIQEGAQREREGRGLGRRDFKF